MPELPEVETIRRQLTQVLPGLTLKSLEVRVAKLFFGKRELVLGKKIVGLRRFGKMLVIDLTGGVSLAIHLKMSGQLVFGRAQAAGSKTKWEIDYPTDKHTHIVISFTNGAKLYFHDLRKFGWMQVVPTAAVAKISYVAKLGPEFLKDLTLSKFVGIVLGSQKPIKLVLMDQEKLAGVGNIYANESLWCAKIYPKTKSNKLLNGQIVKLFNCLEKILKQAIKWQGASDNNYRDAFGQKGEVQEHFNVYNREGFSCPRCKTVLKKFSLGGRGTYFCPKCQET